MWLYRFFVIFALVNLLLSCSGMVRADELIIDRIAAVVDDEVITYRDVTVELVLNMYEKDENNTLQGIINRMLLLREAEKFKITESKEDVEKIQGRLEAIRQFLGDERYNDFLRDYNLRESDIIKKLSDQAIAEKFIEFRINFFVVISEDAIKTFYEEHKADFGEQAIADIHDQIKGMLFTAESEKRLKEYLDGLRRRAKIVINQ